MSVNPIPENEPRVSAYLMVSNVENLVKFLKDVFDAELQLSVPGASDALDHAQVKIGDSVIMMGKVREESEELTSMVHVYVNDCDAVYKKAIDAGAKNIMEPSDQFYGDRSAGVYGPQGNMWWIASRIEKLNEDEIRKRSQEFKAQ